MCISKFDYYLNLIKALLDNKQMEHNKKNEEKIQLIYLMLYD